MSRGERWTKHRAARLGQTWFQLLLRSAHSGLHYRSGALRCSSRSRVPAALQGRPQDGRLEHSVRYPGSRKNGNPLRRTYGKQTSTPLRCDAPDYSQCLAMAGQLSAAQSSKPAAGKAPAKEPRSPSDDFSLFWSPEETEVALNQLIERSQDSIHWKTYEGRHLKARHLPGDSRRNRYMISGQQISASLWADVSPAARGCGKTADRHGNRHRGYRRRFFGLVHSPSPRPFGHQVTLLEAVEAGFGGSAATTVRSFRP